MPSLADLPEVIGFFSYSRDDDEDFDRTLSSLRLTIGKELRAQLGRTKQDFRLWQDQDAIAPGELWETRIAEAINGASFFIPIVTPHAVNSKHCKFEFDTFLAREQELGRNNLIFPILYITVPGLADDAIRRNHPVLSVIGARQFVDWREFRLGPTDAPAYRKAIFQLCASIASALREPWLTPEEKRRQEQDLRLRKEAEARNRAKEEQRRREQDETNQYAAEAERRRKAEAEAQRSADEARRRQEEERRARERPNAPAYHAFDAGSASPNPAQTRLAATSRFHWGPIWKSALIGFLAGVVVSGIAGANNVRDPSGAVGSAMIIVWVLSYFILRRWSSPKT
jgi:TIR domain